MPSSRWDTGQVEVGAAWPRRGSGRCLPRQSMIPRSNLPFYGQPTQREPYRYWLHRDVGAGTDSILFIMLNPSGALSRGSPTVAADNDWTVTRCINIAQSKGYADLTVVNLFAFRTSDPDELLRYPDFVVGEHNNAAIEWALASIHQANGKVVCAWGDYGTLWCRNCYVLQRLTDRGIPGYCLGNRTKKGQPRHPRRISPAAMCRLV